MTYQLRFGGSHNAEPTFTSYFHVATSYEQENPKIATEHSGGLIRLRRVIGVNLIIVSPPIKQNPPLFVVHSQSKEV